MDIDSEQLSSFPLRGLSGCINEWHLETVQALRLEGDR